jgi:peptidoglycan/xylan/chitin deacetylase (PgdA/CDA1 family)
MVGKTLKHVFWALVRASGIPRVVREIAHRRRVVVLAYHRPAPEHFRRHAAYLTRRYNAVPLSLVVDAIRSNDWSHVPPKALVITFDDGWRENYALLGLFREFNIRPTIYLCSAVVGTHRHFWWTMGGRALRKLKGLPHDAFLERLREATGYTPDREYPERQTLSREEMHEMAPYVDFGAHTRTHPILTQCDDALCRDEIEGAKRDLEELLGCRVDHFSYPNGSLGEREARLVREAGYHSGRTFVYLGSNGTRTDPFRLRGIDLQGDASVGLLAAQITGVHRFLTFFRAPRGYE